MQLFLFEFFFQVTEGGAAMLATVAVEVMVLMVATQLLVLLQAEEEML